MKVVKKLVYVVFVTALLLGVWTSASGALGWQPTRWSWCFRDPVILLPDGGVVHVVAAVPEDYWKELVYVDIHGPQGSKLVGLGSGRIPLSVSFTDDAEPNSIWAVASPSGDYDVGVLVQYRGNFIAGACSDNSGGSATTWATIR